MSRTVPLLGGAHDGGHMFYNPRRATLSLPRRSDPSAPGAAAGEPHDVYILERMDWSSPRKRGELLVYRHADVGPDEAFELLRRRRLLPFGAVRA